MYVTSRPTFFFQLWLKSQVSSLVIRFPWNRLVDTVSSLFVCHVASSLRTLVLIRLITMITSMHLTLDAASSCVGMTILFREVALLVVLVLLRHVHIFEVRIDWLTVTVMQAIFLSPFHLSSSLLSGLCTFSFFLIESVIVSSFASDLLMSSFFFDYYFRSGNRTYLLCSCSAFSSSALNDAPRSFYFFE